MEDVRQVLGDRIVISVAKRNEIMGKVAVSPGAVSARYKANIDRYRVSAKVKLRMIVLHRGANQRDAELKHQTAVSLKKGIDDGADFASLARSFSEDIRAGKDGDWGWVEPSTLRKELAGAVSKLKAGEVSPVIETKDGFYLLKVDGLKGESVTRLETVREDIERELRGEQRDRIYRAWIERLRKRSYVRVLAFGPEVEE
jgi:peptidyl-prolyl cis-trans isomerase SurA